MGIGFDEINLPKELVELAVSLKHLGISEIAWNWENVIKIIEYLNKNNCVILGGDVYKLNGSSIEVTYDSWYFNMDEAATKQELLQKSYNRAIAYVNQYHQSNGSKYYYSLVFKVLI